ncbi:MAG TPA: 4'-phosphopantetheinyl transferase superfamily protein [Pseudobdellovibrionaceae bacterium]
MYRKRNGLKKSSDQFVRQCLGNFLDEDPSSLNISRHPSGQPLVEYQVPVYFSLTHSGDFSSLACSLNFDLGLDLQVHQHFNPNLFSTLCTKSELASLKELNQENFFKIWTIKEAALKCLGLGLRFPMNQLHINFDNNHIEVLSDQTKYNWLTYAELSLFENSTTHLVWNRNDRKPNMVLISEV